MHIGGVIGPRRRSDRAVVEQTLFDRQQFVGGSGHQNDVHLGLVDDLTDLFAIFGQRAVFSLLAMVLGAFARGSDAERHIGILGISQHKILAL
ncbi:MAG: hypothetical protein BWY83_03375 [bacterium ADurb.Bin478]|nr:MAG: hypothetical protein BWY83_03375 [bacterium ADurb.Bin478]